MQLELITKPQGPVLGEFSKCRARWSSIMGPLGSGKTIECCQKVLTLMTEQKPNRMGVRKSRWYAVRNTYPDLLGITLKDWMELFRELGRYKGGGMEPPCHYLKFRLPDRTLVQSELIFLALDRPQSIRKLRGAQATGFWFNETKEIDQSIVNMADLRHGRYPSKMDGGPTWHGIIGDTNAPDEDSWYYDLAENVKPKGWKFHVQEGGLLREMRVRPDGKREWTGGWIPNPRAENLHNLPKDYYVYGQEGKTEDWIAVNLANEYGQVHDGKPVYQRQWDKHSHVADSLELVEGIPLVVGLDFGLTPAAVFGQQTPRGTLNVLDELVADGMGINQFMTHVVLPKISNECHKASEVIFIGDPAGNARAETDEQTVFKELYDEFGIEALAANTNNTDVRLEAVRWFLQQLRDGKPAFRIHERCKILIRGFGGGYQFKRVQVVGTSRFHDKADKNEYSHPHDALQYLAMYFRGDYVVIDNGFERSQDYGNEDGLWGIN